MPPGFAPLGACGSPPNGSGWLSAQKPACRWPSCAFPAFTGRAATPSSISPNGTAKRLVKQGQVFNRIHVDDIAGALWHLIERDKGGIFNVTDDLPAPPQDVVAYAAGLMGVEPPPEIPFETAQLSPMARSFYGENKRVSNAAHQAGGLPVPLSRLPIGVRRHVGGAETGG